MMCQKTCKADYYKISEVKYVFPKVWPSGRTVRKELNFKIVGVGVLDLRLANLGISDFKI